MIREITLIVLLASGETKETSFDTEYPCVKAALVESQKGHQAWCLIETPEIIGTSEIYPDER